jgi:hypothetical protein
MRQRGNSYQAKKDRFEDGVLRADSCIDRYSMPRDMQYRTAFEDLAQASFGRRALGEESELIRCVYYLRSLGFSPDVNEDLEGFVARHKDRLDKEVM